MGLLSQLLPAARRARRLREREEAFQEYLAYRYPMPTDLDAYDEEDDRPPPTPPERLEAPPASLAARPIAPDIPSPAAEAAMRNDGPAEGDEVCRTRGQEHVHEGQQTPSTVPPPGAPTQTVVRTGVCDTAADAGRAPAPITPLPPPEGLEVRDGEVLRSLALYRLLSYGQIAELHFPGQLATARRRMRRLERAGWVTLFEERTLRGGHPRYALPTTRTLRWAFDAIAAEAVGTSSEHLVREVLRQQSREGLVLRSPGTPPFLPHQREIGNLVVALRRCYSLGVGFSCAFARPFPLEVNGVSLPQPDFILVAAPFGREPLLVFGEHDRGTEPVARFGRRKVEAYEQLYVRPPLLRKLTGFSAFRVLITVADPVHRRPMERLTALAAQIRKRGGDSTYALAPAGWVATSPDGPVWFTADQPPDPAIPRPNLELHAATGRTLALLEVMAAQSRVLHAQAR